MYFTRLPDHTDPDFDESRHFSRFQKHNIIFNAVSSNSHCDDHVGCLSIKTVFTGEEWYGIDHRQLAVRPGQFLLLNNDQHYSCRICDSEEVRCLSVFFKTTFASDLWFDALHKEETLLEQPFDTSDTVPEFFQTLYNSTPSLQRQLSALVRALDKNGHDEAMTDERLIFLLHYLIRLHKSETRRADKAGALKASTRREIYKRLCIAKDLLQGNFDATDGRVRTVDLGIDIELRRLPREGIDHAVDSPGSHATDDEVRQVLEEGIHGEIRIPAVIPFHARIEIIRQIGREQRVPARSRERAATERTEVHCRLEIAEVRPGERA